MCHRQDGSSPIAQEKHRAEVRRRQVRHRLKKDITQVRCRASTVQNSSKEKRKVVSRPQVLGPVGDTLTREVSTPPLQNPYDRYDPGEGHVPGIIYVHGTRGRLRYSQGE